MRNEFTRATPVSLPANSAVTHAYQSVNLADAYAVQLPAGASDDPEVLARFIFDNQPAWVGKLLTMRDAIVAGAGLKTAGHLATLAVGAGATRLGIFKIYSKDDTEIVIGEDDKHLDFRLSVLCAAPTAPGESRRLTLSTVVHCHNLLGRSYILAIAPFHRMVVKASLNRAARLGWPLRA